MTERLNRLWTRAVACLIFSLFFSSFTMAQSSVPRLDTIYGKYDPSTAWRVIESREQDFEILMPGAAEIEKSEVPVPGMSISRTVYSTFTSFGIFRILSMTSDAKGWLSTLEMARNNIDFRESFLDEFDSGFKKEMLKAGINVAVIGPANYQGLIGREYIVSINGLSSRGRVLCGRKSVFILVALPSAGPIPTDLVTRFINSAKFKG